MTPIKPLGLLTLLACVLTVTGCETLDAGSRSLPLAFNGKDLSGWKVPEPNPFWRVEDGILVGENDPTRKGSMLYTEREYKDFVLECEVRWQGEIDSGFMFRRPELQLQIGVSRSLKVDMTGSFYTGGKDAYPASGRARDEEKGLKPGDWNRFRLEARGSTYTTWINGRKVSQYTNPKYADAGPIGLQIHPGLPMKVEFRKIRIKPLD